MKRTLSLLTLAALAAPLIVSARGPSLTVCSLQPTEHITYDSSYYPTHSTANFDVVFQGGMQWTNRTLDRSICSLMDKQDPIIGDLLDPHNWHRLQQEQAISEHAKRTMISLGFGERVMDSGNGWSFARTGVGTLPEPPTRSVTAVTSSSSSSVSSSSSSHSSSSSSSVRPCRRRPCSDLITPVLAD